MFPGPDGGFQLECGSILRDNQMKKIFILTIGLLALYFCNAQDNTLKTKVTKDQNIATAVTINKKTKQKEGLYLRRDTSTGDTLVAGQYANDKRTGLWRFADKKQCVLSMTSQRT